MASVLSPFTWKIGASMNLIIDNEMDCPGKYGARGSGKEISMPCARVALSVTVVPIYAIGTSEGGMRATMRLRCVEKRS